MAYRAFNAKYTKQMISKAKAIKEGPAAKAKAKGKVVEIAYAFMPDKAGGEDEFALDRGIAPDALFKKLRTHANAERGKNKKKKLTKGSWGTCRIKGKTLFLTPEQEVPSLRMLLKKRLLSADFKEFKLSEVKLLKPGEEPKEDDEQAQQEPEEKAAAKTKKASGKEAAVEAQAATQKGTAKDESASSKAVQKEPAAQAAPSDDVNPFSGEASAATAAAPSKSSAKESAQAAPADAKEGAKEKKEAAKQRAAFKKARQSWVRTRDKALEDLEVVKDAFRKEYMDDPQIKDVNKRIKELDAVMDDLGDDLREALDAYVATPLGKKKALDEQATKARKLLKKFSGYVDKSQLLAAVDGEKGVGDASKVKVKAPLAKALKDLAKTIG